MKHVFPFVALAVFLMGGWFLFSNFKLDLSQQSTEFQAREGGGLATSPFTNPTRTTPPPTTSYPPATTNTGIFNSGIFGSGGSTTQPPATVPPTQVPPNTVPATQSNWPIATTGGAVNQPPAGRRETIRIASFNIQVFGESKLAKTDVMSVLASAVRNFDVVAIQEIRSTRQDIMPNFVQLVNSRGRRYDYVIGPRLGSSNPRDNSKEQYAFLFDTDTIEIDRGTLYTVDDPDDLLHREPLVGWFRCRAADPRAAFTFTLVNLHIDPDEVSQNNPANEINVLDDVLVQVRADGRGEDDVILLGDFNVNDQNLGHLARLPNIAWVISNMPTNTRGNAQYDNIIFDQLATREFMGRGGVFDFMQEYKLSLDQALAVSDHLPIWGEFSVFEGGVPGRVAAQPTTQQSSYRPRSTNSQQQGYSQPQNYARQPAYNEPQQDYYDTQPVYSAQGQGRYDPSAVNPRDTQRTMRRW